MNTPAGARLIHDLKKIASQKADNIQAMPVGDNLLLWTAVIEGPENSVWDGGVFFLKLRFTDDYPFRAPRVNFMSKMFHPNVYNDGRICLDMLQEQWNSVYDVWSILTAILILLAEPNPLSPANAQASKYYSCHRNHYEMRARELVELSLIDNTNYQQKAREEVEAELEAERIRAIKDQLLRKEDEEFELEKRRRQHLKQLRRRKRQLRKLEEEQRRFQSELKVTGMASQSGPPPFYRIYRQHRPLFGNNEIFPRQHRNGPHNPVFYQRVPALIQKNHNEEKRELEEQEEDLNEEQPEEKSEDESIEEPEPCPSDLQGLQEDGSIQNQEQPKEEEENQMDENFEYKCVQQERQREERKQNNKGNLPSTKVVNAVHSANKNSPINVDSSSQIAEQQYAPSSMMVRPRIEHIQPEQPQQQEEGQPEQSSGQLDLNDYSNMDIWLQQALFRSLYHQQPENK